MGLRFNHQIDQISATGPSITIGAVDLVMSGGGVQIEDGLVTVPGLSFGASNTGIFSPSSGKFSVTAGGMEQLRVNTPSAANADVEFSGTGALILNRGNTSQRPSTPVNGMLRYNSQTGVVEGYVGGQWTDLKTGTTVAPIGAQYVVMAASSGLDNERVLTEGSGILITDGGSGNAVTVELDFSSVQPAHVELTGIAALATLGTVERTGTGTYATYPVTGYAKTILDDVNAASARTTLGASSIGSNLFTAGTTAGARSVLGSTVVGDALFITPSASAARTTLELVIGTNVQAFNSTLQTMASVSPGTNTIIYFPTPSSADNTTLTAYGRTLIDDVDAPTARTTLGVGATGDLLFTSATAVNARSHLGLVIGSDVQPYSDLLESITLLGVTGFLVRTSSATSEARTITVGPGLTISNANGVGGNPLISFQDDSVFPGSAIFLIENFM